MKANVRLWIEKPFPLPMPLGKAKGNGENMKKKIEPEPTRLEFESYRKIGNYEQSQFTQCEPSCFNGIVRIRRYKITCELIDEPVEVLAERLQTLWVNADNYHHYEPLAGVAKHLGVVLRNEDFGKNRRR